MGVTEECGRGMGRPSRGPVHDFSVRAPNKEEKKEKKRSITLTVECMCCARCTMSIRFINKYDERQIKDGGNYKGKEPTTSL